MISCSVNGQAFFIVLMKRKKILKEGVQIPYRLDDFKPGDRLHIIGDFDDVSFDNFATVIGTSNDIDSPYSDDAAILVHLDSPNQISGALHDSDTGIPEIKKKCRHNCWWLWMYQFNPEYNYENYRVNYDENRVIKLNHNLPDAYDVISSLYESKDLLKENYINPGIEVGDEVIVSFDYTGENPTFAKNELATVLDVGVDDGWMLLEFKDWHKGHNGHHVYPGKCRSNNCFFVNDGEFFGYLHIRPSNIPDAYDVISSLYESKVLTESRFVHPSIKIGDDVIVSFDYVGENPISVKNELATVLDVNDNGWWLLKFKNWHHGNNAHGEYPNDCYNYNCFYVKDHDRFSTLDVSPVDSLGMPNAYDVISSLYESEDLDWVMNMASDISKNIITPGQYYRVNGKIAYYPFDDTIDLYIKTVDDEVIVYDVISVGNITWSAKDEKVSLETASRLVNDNYWMPISKEKSLFNKKRMDESEDLDWAMDMAKNIDDSQLKLLEIPKEKNGYYNIILLDKPGITYQTIANIVDYINNETSWKSTLSSGDIKDIHNNYTKKGFSYINLRPNNSVSYGSSEDTFAFLYDMDFSDPSVKTIRPY